jgi:hypothetical protein
MTGLYTNPYQVTYLSDSDQLKTEAIELVSQSQNTKDVRGEYNRNHVWNILAVENNYRTREKQSPYNSINKKMQKHTSNQIAPNFYKSISPNSKRTPLR